MTKRLHSAIDNFHSLAFSGESVDIPAKRAKSRDLEHKEQMAVIQFWRYEHKRYGVPECALMAVPNGSLRDIRVAVKLKAEGVRAGVSDLFLAVPRGKYHGCWLEMKSTEGRLQDVQHDFLAEMIKLGYAGRIGYGADDAIRQLKEYLGEPHGK